MGAVLARIEPLSYETISKSLLIMGETSLTGEVVRVGGEEPHFVVGFASRLNREC